MVILHVFGYETLYQKTDNLPASVLNTIHDDGQLKNSIKLPPGDIFPIQFVFKTAIYKERKQKMKITFSHASPYVRKVMACAIARGIENQLEKWSIPATDPSIRPYNPLSKVPTLVKDDGGALFDSPVICEYLDTIGTAAPVFPVAGPARWNALRLQALGDGIMDASQPRRREMGLPQDDGRIAYIELQQGKVARALDALEQEVSAFGSLTTIGEITVACALGYLDFRFASEPWRPGHPKLDAWYAQVVQLPPLAHSMPAG